MDEVKWAWVLFMAATLAVLVRIAMWFLPAPAVLHSEQVTRAAEGEPPAAPMAAEVEVPPPPEPVAAIPEEPEWPDEELKPREPGLAEAMRKFQTPSAPLPPPEVFHLRRVRWGMTIDDVRAAEPGEPLRESGRALLYATTTLEMPCLLTYSFSDGRLVRARLAFSDPAGRDIPPLSMAQAQQRFLHLREQLRGRYGEAIEKTTLWSRDVSALQRRAQKQDELARQYDTEIAEAEARLKNQRVLLANRFARWSNPAERVAQAIAPYERDLNDLKDWKKEALENAARSRQDIRKFQEADAAHPLIATMTARWSFAREMHDIELQLDCRQTVPSLDIRYEGSQVLPSWYGSEL